MGTVKKRDHTLWIRCWDGTEMEYENFSIDNDLVPMLKQNNQAIANQIGAVLDVHLEEALNEIRDNR